MLEFLWWAFLLVVGAGIGFYAAGLQAAVFMALVCTLGGMFLLIEKKLHPVIDADRKEQLKSK